MAGRDSDRRLRRRHEHDQPPHSSSYYGARSVVVQRDGARTSTSSKQAADAAARRLAVPPTPPSPPSPPQSAAVSAAAQDLLSDMTPYRRPTVYEEDVGRYKYSGRRRSGSEVNPVYEDLRYQRRPRPEDPSTTEEEDELYGRSGAVSSGEEGENEPEYYDAEQSDDPERPRRSAGRIVLRSRPMELTEKSSAYDVERRAPSLSSEGSVEDHHAAMGGAALSSKPALGAIEAPVSPRHKRPTVELSPHSPKIRQRTSHRRSRQSDPVVLQDPPIRKPKHAPTRSESARSSSHHHSSVLSSIMSSSTGPRPSPERRRRRSKEYQKPAKTVQCISCISDVRPTRAPKLRCGHRMCHTCLRRIFELSLRDQQTMPPRCCTKHPIPLRLVEPLFDDAFKAEWDRKHKEWSTRDRLYCPSRRCGEWIKPSQIRREHNRESVRCGHCKTKICVACNGKWHSSSDCPNDEETQLFLRKAKEQGWQRCHACKAMVERQQGCNHMTCRCGAQFCMLCGGKWKSCDCEWFNFGPIDNVAGEGSYIEQGEMVGDFSDSDDSSVRGGARDQGSPRNARIRTRGHAEHRQRTQEERDADLARRLQYDMSLENEFYDYDDEHDDEQDMMAEGVGLGLAPGHHRNDHHRHGGGRHRTRHSPTSAMGYDRVKGHRSPPRASYDRGGGYVVDVSRARGVRGDSMERRLAERLSEHRPSMSGPSPSMLGSYHVPHAGSSGIDGSSMMPQAVPPPPMGPYPTMPGLPMALPTSSSAPMMTVPPPHPFSSLPHHSPVPAHAPHFPGVPLADYPPAPHGRAPVRRRESDGGAAPRSSSMAGLTAQGAGSSRVDEWMKFVEPGVPEGDRTRALEERPSRNS